MSEPCPSQDSLHAYADGLLRGEAHVVIDEHVRSCASCRVHARPISGGETTVLTDDPSGESPSRGEIDCSVSEGDVVGRYVVEGRLGAGAMGVVFAARDPKLDRTVALKVIRGAVAERSPSAERFIREAQALAKVSHPNVVAVFDVGKIGDELFIAMEYVDGAPLSQWMRHQPRHDWRTIIAMFVAVGRGLAAVHAQDIVHRDIKPDNVMVASDGRPRVMDFGLASEDRTTNAESQSSGGHQSLEYVASRLTQTGDVMGTPAYMSPEQLKAQPLDARSDQFSFCVSLYEALYGVRPFTARTLPELVALVCRGKVELPEDDDIPRQVRQVIETGLCVDREDRFRSMDALIEVLENALGRPRRRLALGGGLVLLSTVAVASLVAAQEATPACAALAQRLEGIWDADVRGEVTTSLEATGLPFAPSSATRVQDALDAYALEWVEARQAACEATRDAGPSRANDLQVACFDDRIEALAATTSVLREADSAVTEQALAMVRELPLLERCSDPAALTAQTPPPDDPETVRAVARITPQIARAEALSAAGKSKEALAVLDANAEEIESIDHPPFTARALYRRGQNLRATGDYVQGERALVAAYQIARDQGMTELAASLAADLAVLVGVTLARDEDAQRWERDATILAGSVGTDRARASFLLKLARLRSYQGQVAEAREMLDEAWQCHQRVEGSKTLAGAALQRAMGHAAIAVRDYEAAREHFSMADQVVRRLLGPQHPLRAASLAGLAVAARTEGKLTEARELNDEALSIQRATYGDRHTIVAASLTRAGSNARSAGDITGAGDYYREAAEIWSEALGAEHPRVARALVNIGAIEDSLGHDEEARSLYMRALKIQRAELDTNHPDIATTLHNLAEAESDLGLLDEASGHYQRAAALMEAAFGEDSAFLAFPLTGLGEVALRQGDPESAREVLERAYSLLPTEPEERDEVGETAFALARALWASDPVDRDRAASLAREAAVAFERLGEREKQRRAEVLTWMRAHGIKPQL